MGLITLQNFCVPSSMDYLKWSFKCKRPEVQQVSKTLKFGLSQASGTVQTSWDCPRLLEESQVPGLSQALGLWDWEINSMVLGLWVFGTVVTSQASGRVSKSRGCSKLFDLWDWEINSMVLGLRIFGTVPTSRGCPRFFAQSQCPETDSGFWVNWDWEIN